MKNFKKLTMYDESIETTTSNSTDPLLGLDNVMQWVGIEEGNPNDCESLIGIEMPYEARYACHREDNMYISDETGESVVITHWMYAPKPPCA